MVWVLGFSLVSVFSGEFSRGGVTLDIQVNTPNCYRVVKGGGFKGRGFPNVP